MMAFGFSLAPGQTSALRYRVPGTDLDPAEGPGSRIGNGDWREPSPSCPASLSATVFYNGLGARPQG
jgi:hypothetical protein